MSSLKTPLSYLKQLKLKLAFEGILIGLISGLLPPHFAVCGAAKTMGYQSTDALRVFWLVHHPHPSGSFRRSPHGQRTNDLWERNPSSRRRLSQ